MSVKPFWQAIGLWWLAIAGWSSIPNNVAMDFHSCELNSAPLSDVISIEIPKWANQCNMSACAQVVLVISLRGMASGYQEKLSSIVSQ